jgi:hypothetical protein
VGRVVTVQLASTAGKEISWGRLQTGGGGSAWRWAAALACAAWIQAASRIKMRAIVRGL